MSVSAERTTRLRLSDPRPSYCSGCFRGSEDGVKFVDFDAAIDRGQIVEERDGVVWHRETIDDLHLCEACVRDAMEVLALRPQASARQMREIKRLEQQLTALRGYSRTLERAVAERPAAVKGGEARGV